LAKFEDLQEAEAGTRKGSRDDLVDFLADSTGKAGEQNSCAKSSVIAEFFPLRTIHEAIVDDPREPGIAEDSESLPGYLRLEEVEHLLEQPDGSTRKFA